MAENSQKIRDLNRIFDPPQPFEMDLPWGDYHFSQRFLKVVNDWGIPTEREVAFIDSYVDGKAAILDLACGGGRHSIGLARKGNRMTAVEIGGYPVRKAVEIAREEKLSVEFVEADIRKIEYNREFDLAFLICGQLGHFSPDDARTIFRNASRAVKPGGVFIVHLMVFGETDRATFVQWYREKEPFYFDHPSVVHREQYYVADQRVKIIRDFAVDTVTRQNRLFGISEKYYRENELRSFAAASGLVLTEKYGDYLKNPLTEKSSSNIFIFRRF